MGLDHKRNKMEEEYQKILLILRFLHGMIISTS
jgi:hypothetical protein